MSQFIHSETQILAYKESCFFSKANRVQRNRSALVQKEQNHKSSLLWREHGRCLVSSILFLHLCTCGTSTSKASPRKYKVQIALRCFFCFVCPRTPKTVHKIPKSVRCAKTIAVSMFALGSREVAVGLGRRGQKVRWVVVRTGSRFAHDHVGNNHERVVIFSGTRAW